MPIHTGQDIKGHFYQWGGQGKKYYYDPKSEQSKEAAKHKAGKQAQAAYSHGYRE